MAWTVCRPTLNCPVFEVLPTLAGELQAGHNSGIECLCWPCLTDPDDEHPVLVHHEILNGKPTPPDEPDAHKCRLKRS